jgi:hypothetical protein
MARRHKRDCRRVQFRSRHQIAFVMTAADNGPPCTVRQIARESRYERHHALRPLDEVHLRRR